MLKSIDHFDEILAIHFPLDSSSYDSQSVTLIPCEIREIYMNEKDDDGGGSQWGIEIRRK